MNKTLGATLLAAGVAFGGLAVSAPAWSEPAGAQACVLVADPVTQSGSSLSAHGGRTGCGSPANVTVKLNKDISAWPDSTLAEQTVSGTEVSLHPQGVCEERSQYYTYTVSNTGNTLEGRHAYFC